VPATQQPPSCNFIRYRMTRQLPDRALGLGHPIWGTHKKMNGSAEQESHEFMRLKHHSHGLKNQHLG